MTAVTRRLSRGDHRHGTTNGYNHYRCRCNRCRQAHADYNRSHNHKIGKHKPMAQYFAELVRVPVQHGTLNAYSNRNCRCDECRKVWAVHCREQNHRAGRHQPMHVYLAALRARAEANPPPHGTETRYKNGCRCEDCRGIATRARRRRRQAQTLRENGHA
jgi:hypothetical protein